jgi:hypothetical protein
MNPIFIMFSIICVIGAVLLTILSLMDILQCDDDQGIGSVIMIIIEIPLFILTYFFSGKSKAIILRTTSKIS